MAAVIFLVLAAVFVGAVCPCILSARISHKEERDNDSQTNAVPVGVLGEADRH